MLNEEDERPPNEKSHTYHFSITYNGCEFCLLILLQFLLSTNVYLKDGVCKFVVSFAYDPVLVIEIEKCSILHKDEHKRCET